MDSPKYVKDLPDGWYKMTATAAPSVWFVVYIDHTADQVLICPLKEVSPDTYKRANYPAMAKGKHEIYTLSYYSLWQYANCEPLEGL